MSTFLFLNSFLGGLCIGLAALLLLLLNGRILGISGIAFGLLSPKPKDVGWRILFILGLVLGAGLVGKVAMDANRITIQAPLAHLLIGGFLVGYGTSLGGGCTSGHGICGMGRFSKRSILATTCFIASGILTVYVLRHLWGG